MDVMALRRNIVTGNHRLPFRERTVVGNPVSFRTNADKPLNELLIPFLPIQQGTGDPSLENERPVRGWTGLTAWRTGVNIWDEEVELGGINSSTGQPYAATAALRAKNYIPVVPGTKYYFKSSSASSTRCWYDKDKNYISTGYVVNMEITAPDNAYFFRFDLPLSYGTTYKNDISLNYPSTDTEYHPYIGQSYHVTFPALGKNLFNPALAEPGYYTDKGAKHAQSNTNYEYRMTNYIPVDGIEKITVGYANLPSGETKWNSVCWYDENKNFMARSAGTSGTDLTVFTVREGAKYVRANMRTYNQGVEYCFLAYGEQQFELFDNTIYEAMLNAPTGVLTVDKLGVDLGAEEWTYSSQYSRFESTDHTDIKYTKARELQGICSCYPVISDGRGIDQVPDKSIYGGRKSTSASAPRKLYVKDSSFGSDASAFKTAMQGQIFVCELATPYEIQLDPIAIQTLIGDNTIWSDTNGSNTVKYLKRG